MQEIILMSLKTIKTTYFHDFYSKFLHLRNSIQGRLVDMYGEPHLKKFILKIIRYAVKFFSVNGLVKVSWFWTQSTTCTLKSAKWIKTLYKVAIYILSLHFLDTLL